MQEAMKNAKCSNCGAVATPGDVSNISMEQHLRFENERLRDELRRVDDLAHKFLGKPLTSSAETVPPMISNRELDLGGVGRNGFDCLNSMNQWIEMFPCIIGRASTSDVIFPGMVKSKNGELQLDASMLMLQETCTDAFESLVIHAAVDPAGMDVVMSGGNSTFLPFLPSGFAIVPDLFHVSDELNYNKSGSGGSLLTIGFHILASTLFVAKLTTESIDTMRTLMTRTLHGIRAGFDQCNVQDA
ncbi:homeobox-leucine zipper protein HDG1-like [Forsythia ovata]|uniref:Homeobox-leucine zipper protein HDG1-like n=1 Tax=Forsythia ovata TaxID=205694 RepID=A0ABD1WKZ2_9LAMI